MNDVAGTLPRWDLSHLYAGPDSPGFEADIESARQLAKSFKENYRGRLSVLSGGELGRAIGEFERLEEILGKLMTFAHLRFAADVADPENGRFLQTVRERINTISTDILFFPLELNRLDDMVLAAQLQHPETAAYAPWIKDQRLFRDHQLDDELERLLHEKEVTGRAAWVRLFDETLAGLRFSVAGKSLGLSETLNLMSSSNGSERQAAAEALGRVLGENLRLFAMITNTLAKDKELEDNWRRFPRPVSSQNLANRVEDEVVEALVSSVEAAFPELSHRYYRLKAEWFGVEALDYWDRNAPLPGDADRRYSWDEAREIVLAAFGGFDPRMADVARRFFDEGWIDAQPRPGKDSGAFSHPCVPSVHPYILMNFHGKARDVMTLAHELGHGVHQVLAAPRGVLMSDTPLTLAETASVFGEMLTFRSLLDGESDRGRRRILLAGKVEDMLNTVVRQIAFHGFESRVHDERRAGELSPERLGEIWMDIQGRSLGPGIRFDDGYRAFWAYIPHFIHVPFYVYAYAFGDCLVNSLYGVYQGGMEGFRDKYRSMLEAGGTMRHREMLAPFGLDASDPGFWKHGIKIISGLIDELEAMG